MKSWVTISWLFLLPSIRAAALPQLIGDELESTSSPLKRDVQGNLATRSPKPDFAEPESTGSKREFLPEAVASMTDDPSLGPSSNLKRDLSARSPQGPDSNPGEFIGVGISRANPANHHTSSGSSSSSSSEEGNRGVDGVNNDSKVVVPIVVTEDDGETRHHRHHNSSHHYKVNGTHREHREPGILGEFNSHGEHIVIYNGTHFPNGTRYSPANTTLDGGKLINETVIAGDEIAVYREPFNRHHHHHPHNFTGGPMPTPTGVWLPSGTGWIPSSTGRPRYHRKVPSQDLAGFRGPKRKGHWKEVANTFWDGIVY